MCGILAIATLKGHPLPLTDAQALSMRDTMAHRGPDGAGLWWSADRSVCLGHRRLAVLGLEPASSQPMVLGGGAGGALSRDHFQPGNAARTSSPASQTLALVYNGEWYGEPVARRALQHAGLTLQTTSDTETLLRTLARRGLETLDGFRGMFGLALHDAQRNTLMIARDPLGIKPVYWAKLAWQGVEQIIVASEPTAILKHPGMTALPDWAMVSAYISHSRAVLGDRCMFRDVHTLLPGEVIEFQLGGQRITERRRTIALHPTTVRVGGGNESRERGARAVRRAVEDSVVRHLRADVPTCALLSGGLDSTILTLIARDHTEGLATFAAGARPEPGQVGAEESSDDLTTAALVAARFGLRHDQAAIAGDFWKATWTEMVQRLGVPMSTPNEVAIYAVSRLLRQRGCVVTLSGEGADELMLGYTAPLETIRAGVSDGRAARDPAGFAMEISTWINSEHKALLMRDEVWQAAGTDIFRRIAFERALEDSAGWFGSDGRGTTFASQAGALARLNLNALLRRLDTATMLAGVEGRTPFADRSVARVALGIDAATHYVAGPGVASPGKLVLRRAFGDRVPDLVMRRAKASFPLPFQGWLGCEKTSQMVRGSEFLRCVYHDEAIEAVAENPYGNWMLAWPMINLAVWAQRWGWDARVMPGVAMAAGAR